MDIRTPLYDWHAAHGGKLVSFAGYSLPVQYATGVIAEHEAVRSRAGLFDVSHMGEIEISGSMALAAVNRLVSADCTDMPIGKVRYALLCDESGGIVDDLVVCKMEETRYFLVVNAANRHKDFAWILDHLAAGAVARDLSDEYAQIALQGPLAPAIMSRLATAESIPARYYTLIERGVVADIPCIVSRTGYTGEVGFELYCAPSDAVTLWERLLAAGSSEGAIPCGLGCRDTLRLEAAMPLYGHEMSDSITPFEARLGGSVKMEKADFVGKAALAGKTQPTRVRVGLRMTGHGIARGGERVFAGSNEVGFVTSGSWLPTLKGAFAMALVATSVSAVGTAVDVVIRDKRVAAEVVALPFYSRQR